MQTWVKIKQMEGSVYEVTEELSIRNHDSKSNILGKRRERPHQTQERITRSQEFYFLLELAKGNI